MDEKTKKAALRRARAKLRRAELRAKTFRRVREVQMMPAATTATLPGHSIAVSLGVIVAEIVRVGDILSNLAVDFRDGWGGRSTALEKLLSTARRECLHELRMRADSVGANAIVGVRLDVELPTKALLVVVGSATAVVVEATQVEASDDQTDEQARSEVDGIDEFGTCATCGEALVLADEDATEASCPVCELPPLPEALADDIEPPAAPT
jgi:uncharacterized protein YbjQ (UPF0145 family)